MPHAIKHLFHIASDPNKVFEAIHTMEGASQWWTAETSGDSKMGGTLEFLFGGAYKCTFIVETLEPGKLVQWRCTEGAGDGIGTTLTFKLDTNDGRTRVRFDHDGWAKADDFYAICCFSRGRYMESLRQLCQTGKGEWHGTPGFRK